MNQSFIEIVYIGIKIMHVIIDSDTINSYGLSFIKFKECSLKIIFTKISC